MPNLVTLETAAARLGVHISTLRAWVRTGRVPAYRLGRRYVRVDLDVILAGLETLRRQPETAARPARRRDQVSP